MMKTVVHDSWGPLVLLAYQPHFGREERRTQVFHQDFLSGHDICLLANERLAVLQELLLFGVEESEAIGVPPSSLLCQLIFDILNSGRICDFDASREPLDRLLCSCKGCQRVAEER